MMRSLHAPFRALVIGASGGIGHALAERLAADPGCRHVERLARRGNQAFDLRDESSVAGAAMRLADDPDGRFDLILNATGVLQVDERGPEKSLRAIDPLAMREMFEINTIGPALLLKHFSPLLRRDHRAVFVLLSARVGSIGDNRLGGWISYRASKAALNQVVRTAAIENLRRLPHSLTIALHPGTVDTALSRPFAGTRDTLTPDACAHHLLTVIDRLTPEDNGGFLAWDGRPIPW
ncbi:MAG: SDR family NAD(P)-dependent oxidoreductase [Burkholderiaceae bacterium]